MKLMYDFEIGLTPSQFLKINSGIMGDILKETKSFIRQRWQIFEEELFEIKDAKVIIRLRFSPCKIGFDYYNINTHLREKMEESFSSEDAIYLGKKIDATHQNFLDFLKSSLQ